MRAAGILIEPPPSVPTARGINPAAAEAAGPELDPPVTWAVLKGFLTSPQCSFKPIGSPPNSCMSERLKIGKKVKAKARRHLKSQRFSICKDTGLSNKKQTCRSKSGDERRIHLTGVRTNNLAVSSESTTKSKRKDGEKRKLRLEGIKMGFVETKHTPRRPALL